MNSSEKKNVSWLETIAVYLQWPIVQVFLLGIASGFPLLLTGGTLSARLFESGIDIKTIGILASIGLPYSLKFLAAPIIDAVHLPGAKSHLAHRKSWTILLQVCLVCTLFGMACIDPAEDIFLLAILAFMTAVFSAMQDIVIDALRIECLKKDEQGAGSAATIAGYRIGMLMAGAGAFLIAHFYSWQLVYYISAAVMLACIGITLSFTRLRGIEEREKEREENKDPLDADTQTASDDNAKTAESTDDHDDKKAPCQAEAPQTKPRNYKEFFYTAVIGPFSDFFKRDGALSILLFIALFKLGDAMASTLSGVFYLDLGFDKVEIAAIQKGVGVVAILVGTFIGGLIVKKMPILKALILGGILQIVSNFGFVWLAHQGADVTGLTVVIVIENVTGGIGSAVFVAYLSQLCNARFTATQYALLSSLSSLGRTLFASTAGMIQAANGWSMFFVITAVMGVPGMLLIYFVQKNCRDEKDDPETGRLEEEKS